MTHCTEDDLILHYYGETADNRTVRRHLDSCADCSAAYRLLEETLRSVPTPGPPERDDSYPRVVWQRLRGNLLERDTPWWRTWFAWQPPAIAAAVAAMIVAAFVLGRQWPASMPDSAPPVMTRISVASPDAGERIRLAAIGDHLEQSERVLLDLVNAQGDRVDVTDQQMSAADLIDSNRLYRDAATRAGDLVLATVLDDLERSLLDVVHGPSTMTPAELDDVRGRVDAAALLFKVRVLAGELHDRETPHLQVRKTT